MALVRMKPPVGVSVGLGADDKLYYIDGQGFANVDSGSVTKLTAEGWVSAVPVAPEAPKNTSPVEASKTLTGEISFLSSLTALPLVINDQSSASYNTALLNAALASGKKYSYQLAGTVWINDYLIRRSACDLSLGENTEIKQVPGTNKPLLVTSSYDDYVNGRASDVTLSWSSGSSVSVAWPAHGKSVGDYVYIGKKATSDTDDSAFSGVFRVNSVIDSGNITVLVRRTPKNAPAVVKMALAATVFGEVRGGIWNYNFTDNPTTAQTLNRMCVIHAFTAMCKFEPAKFVDLNKYCVMVAADYASEIGDIFAPSAASDGLKIYGPSHGTKFGDVTGDFGDDMVSMQTYEQDAFAGYRLTWGDLIDIDGDNIDGKSTTAGCVVYGSTNETVDNIKLKSVSGSFPAASAVKMVGNNTTAATNKIGKVDFGVVTCRSGSGSGFNVYDVTVDYLKLVSNFRPADCFLQGQSGATGKINYLEWTITGGDSTLPAATAYFAQFSGTVKKSVISGNITMSSNGRGVQSPTTGGTMDDVDFVGLRVSGGNQLIVHQSGANYPMRVTLDRCVLDGTYQGVSASSAAASVEVRANGSTFNNVQGGVVRLSGATVTAKLKDNGDNRLLGSSVISVANGGTVAAW